MWRNTDTENGYAVLHVAKIISGCPMGSLARAGNVAYSIKISLYNIISIWGYGDCLHVYIPVTFLHNTRILLLCLSI